MKQNLVHTVQDSGRKDNLKVWFSYLFFAINFAGSNLASKGGWLTNSLKFQGD